MRVRTKWLIEKGNREKQERGRGCNWRRIEEEEEEGKLGEKWIDWDE